MLCFSELFESAVKLEINNYGISPPIWVKFYPKIKHEVK